MGVSEVVEGEGEDAAEDEAEEGARAADERERGDVFVEAGVLADDEEGGGSTDGGGGAGEVEGGDPDGAGFEVEGAEGAGALGREELGEASGWPGVGGSLSIGCWRG